MPKTKLTINTKTAFRYLMDTTLTSQSYDLMNNSEEREREQEDWGNVVLCTSISYLLSRTRWDVSSSTDWHRLTRQDQIRTSFPAQAPGCCLSGGIFKLQENMHRDFYWSSSPPIWLLYILHTRVKWAILSLMKMMRIEASAIHSLLSLLIIFSFNSDPLGDVTVEMERRWCWHQ